MNTRKRPAKFTVTVDPSLNGLDATKMATEKLEETNKMLSRIKMPDSYYEQQRKKAQQPES
jgi:hypothetical protein